MICIQMSSCIIIMEYISLTILIQIREHGNGFTSLLPEFKKTIRLVHFITPVMPHNLIAINKKMLNSSWTNIEHKVVLVACLSYEIDKDFYHKLRHLTYNIGPSFHNLAALFKWCNLISPQSGDPNVGFVRK